MSNIVDLIANHRDSKGWFLCPCGKHGYIEKRFDKQEFGEVWEPYLRGIIPLGDADDTYQPFVFLISYEPTSQPTDIWFSYYKDLRSSGGRLKLGCGPGGPPVLAKARFLNLLSQLVKTQSFTRQEIIDAVNESVD
ncbi:MAG: hypothetical protein PHD76_07565 [Methylacidiphilales bacterium]|nr:hypothetical protein [Candidatus Methylacidiphilales bacterium]